MELPVAESVAHVNGLGDGTHGKQKGTGAGLGAFL